MSKVTATVVRDDWDGKDGSKNILVIQVDGVATHVFQTEHPVAMCYLQQVAENKRLLEKIQALAAVLEPLAQLAQRQELVDGLLAWLASD